MIKNEESYRDFVKIWWPYIKKNNIKTVEAFEKWINKCKDIKVLQDSNRRATLNLFLMGMFDKKELQKWFNGFWLLFKSK